MGNELGLEESSVKRGGREGESGSKESESVECLGCYAVNHTFARGLQPLNTLRFHAEMPLLFC